jgi:hypothetical protein
VWSLGGFLLLFVVVYIVNRMDSARIGLALLVGYMVLWLIGTLYLNLRCNYFVCPRCGKYFESQKAPWLNARRLPRNTCANCGLRRYEDA